MQNDKSKIKKYLVLMTAAIFMINIYPVSAYVMSSDNYRIEKDSINIGGGDEQSSTNYVIADTVGEVATGLLTSDNYNLRAGYRGEAPTVLTFSIIDSSVDLGTLNVSSATTSSGTFRIATNADNGYNIVVSGDTLTAGSNDIDALALAAVSAPGTEQFGVNLVANTSPSVGADPSGGSGQASTGYDTANNFKYASGDTIASYASHSSNTTFTVSYLANISTSTTAGNYSTTLTLLATGNF